MQQSKLILPDGTAVSSGAVAAAAIQKLSLTQTVNPETELSFGAVCSQMLEATLWAPAGLALQAGERVGLYQQDTYVGQFILEKPRRSGNLYKLTAYDPISCLDRDMTGFIASLQGWPYTLLELTRMICSACGLAFANEQIPNGELLVQKFSAQAVTGRQLISWAAQAAGCFCRAADDKAEFAWYTPAPVAVSGSGDAFYYAGSLSCADYQVSPISAVQIRRESTDIGTVYPTNDGGENVYIIEANPFLAAGDSSTLLPAAQVLYERLQGVSYTPCQLAVPSSLQLCAGQILRVSAPGQTFDTYIMKRIRSGGKDTLYSTGSLRRGSSYARNQASYKALSGKVLRLQTDVDGIKAENADAAGNLSRIELNLQGLRTQVQTQQETDTGLKQQIATLELDSNAAKLQLQSIREEGVSKVVTATGYSFTQDGLFIQKDGQEMENRLDHTGMYVRRSGQVILQANNQGVAARDVTVENYLTIGENARFEDYSNGTDHDRTACFYIGGSYGTER